MKSVRACHQSITITFAAVLWLVAGQQAWAQGSGLDFFAPVDVAIQSNGTLVVVDQGNRRRSVVQVDPLSGNRITLSNDNNGGGTAFEEPSAILVENDQSFLVVDETLDAVLRVNAITGNRVLLSGCPQTPDPCPVSLVGNGPAFDNPMDIAMSPDGTIVVVDENLATLVEVDPLTGERTTVSGSGVGTGPALMAPKAIAPNGTGGWFVTDVGRNAVLLVTPTTGTRTIVSDVTNGSGAAFRYPAGIDVAPDNSLLVVDALLAALIRVDPETGDRAVVSDVSIGSGPALLLPVSVAVASDGAVFVVDQSYQSVFQVDVLTGERTVVSRAATLTIAPPSGRYVADQIFDLALIAIGGGDMAINITATLNGNDVLPALQACFSQRPLPGGGMALRCQNAAEVLNLTPGRHMLDVGLALLDSENLVTSPRLEDEVVWEILIAP